MLVPKFQFPLFVYAAQFTHQVYGFRSEQIHNITFKIKSIKRGRVPGNKCSRRISLPLSTWVKFIACRTRLIKRFLKLGVCRLRTYLLAALLSNPKSPFLMVQFTSFIKRLQLVLLVSLYTSSRTTLSLSGYEGSSLLCLSQQPPVLSALITCGRRWIGGKDTQISLLEQTFLLL